MACRSFQLLKGFKLNIHYILLIFLLKTRCYVKMLMRALCSHELKFFRYTDKWDILIPYVNFIVLTF